MLGPLIKRTTDKHVRIVALKTNKDLAGLGALFEAGNLKPVIDGPYELAHLTQAMHRFGVDAHKGKIVITVD